MIVLHVARARTDSINIRGSFGKTQAALWITSATFLYFSGCNAHTPFTLFPFSSSFLRLSPTIFYAFSIVFVAFYPRLSFTRPSSSYASLFHSYAILLVFSFFFPFIRATVFFFFFFSPSLSILISLSPVLFSFTFDLSPLAFLAL